MTERFTAARRGGDGKPLMLIHGFTDTWRTWDLVLPRLERDHDVLAPTLPGHAGGPPLGGRADVEHLLDELERTLDDAGWADAHLVGNSLGGYLALALAARGRARSVVALAPAGGWTGDSGFFADVMAPHFRSMREQLLAVEPLQLEQMLASPEGRRLATALVTVEYEHLPAELIGHMLHGAIACEGADTLIEGGLDEQSWELDARHVECPVRIVWGVEDRILPWPAAAARYREEWLPRADWVILDGVGHCPQLDVPLETAELIAGHIATWR